MEEQVNMFVWVIAFSFFHCVASLFDCFVATSKYTLTESLPLFSSHIHSQKAHATSQPSPCSYQLCTF